MPDNKGKSRWHLLSDDEDHVSNKDKTKKMPTSTSPSGNANSRDLGSGAAKNAVEAVRHRRQQMMDET